MSAMKKFIVASMAMLLALAVQAGAEKTCPASKTCPDQKKIACCPAKGADQKKAACCAAQGEQAAKVQSPKGKTLASK